MSYNENSNRDTSKSWERGAGLFLAFIVIVGFIYFLGNPPAQSPTLLPTVRFLSAVVAGLAGYLITGNLDFEGRLPFSRLQIRAGGAFAAFIMVFLLFFTGIPDDNSAGNELFKNAIIRIIQPKMDEKVSAPGGHGAKLDVELDNIPFKDQRIDKYQVAAFAKVEDNPDWYFQGIESVDKELSFPLKLWDKGDKKYYDAIVIISASNSENLERIKTQSELDQLAIKKSKKIRFYRNDSAVQS